MKLSIVIPVYNEDKTLAQIISKIKAADIDDVEKEIIVIDDGSKDKTKDILKNLGDGSFCFFLLLSQAYFVNSIIVNTQYVCNFSMT